MMRTKRLDGDGEGVATRKEKSTGKECRRQKDTDDKNYQRARDTNDQENPPKQARKTPQKTPKTCATHINFFLS